MARVAVVHPDANAGGGAEAVCAHTVEALSRDNEVTLITWSPPDRAALDTTFGTHLAGAAFEVAAVAERAGHGLGGSLERRLLLKHALTFRAAQDLAPRFEAVVSTHGEIALPLSLRLPTPAVQYIYIPEFSGRIPLQVVTGENRAAPYRLYRRAATVAGRLLARGSGPAFRRNLTVACSEYSARWMQAAWGIGADVLWPPVPLAPVPDVPWDERENGIVCIGRLAPAKRVLELIGAVGEARRRSGVATHLHVVGEGSGPYADAVRQACRGSDHATLEGTLSLADLAHLLAHHRFGVHGNAYEHFGIAIAQLVRAGCVCFAPNGGGPADTLADAPSLLYRGVDELAEKLASVLRDADLQRQLLAELRPLKQRLDQHRFGERMERLVSRCLAAARPG